MTTLEIKRIDSVRSKTTSSSGLNSQIGSPTSSYTNQKNRYSLQQNGYTTSPPQTNNPSPSKTAKSPTSSSVNDQLPDVVPITIVKSPSYTNQLTSLAQVRDEMINKISQAFQ